MLGKGRLFLFGTIEEEKKRNTEHEYNVWSLFHSIRRRYAGSFSLPLFRNFSYIFREISETREFLFLATNKTEEAQRGRERGPRSTKDISVCVCKRANQHRWWKNVWVCARRRSSWRLSERKVIFAEWLWCISRRLDIDTRWKMIIFTTPQSQQSTGEFD